MKTAGGLSHAGAGGACYAAAVLFRSRCVAPDEFERTTGWALRPEGLCHGQSDRCVPLPAGTVRDGRVDVVAAAARLRMPVVADEARGLWSLGPEADGPLLSSVEAPDLVLPDLEGRPFALRSLRGQKVLLVAWASW